MDAATELRTLRAKAHVRQYELAGLLGMDATKLSLMENGRRPISDATLQKVREILADKVPA